MSLTVKKLKEILSTMEDDAVVINEQCEVFVHSIVGDELILSTVFPIGHCDRTGGYVYPSKVKGYTAVSPELDEDLYSHEWTPFSEEERLDINVH